MPGNYSGSTFVAAAVMAVLALVLAAFTAKYVNPVAAVGGVLIAGAVFYAFKTRVEEGANPLVLELKIHGWTLALALAVIGLLTVVTDLLNQPVAGWVLIAAMYTAFIVRAKFLESYLGTIENEAKSEDDVDEAYDTYYGVRAVCAAIITITLFAHSVLSLAAGHALSGLLAVVAGAASAVWTAREYGLIGGEPEEPE